MTRPSMSRGYGSATLHGYGFGSWLKKAGRSVGKVAKTVYRNPVAQGAFKIYKQTVAPRLKDALVGAVGSDVANKLESAGRNVVVNQMSDKPSTLAASVGNEAKATANSAIQEKLAGGSVRTSDLIKGARKRASVKVVKINAKSSKSVSTGGGVELEESI